MLTLGIAQTSLALLSLTRIIAPSKQKKGKNYAFHRSRLSQSLLAHMATHSDNARLHSQQLQVLHDVQGRVLPYAAYGMVGRGLEGTSGNGASR